MGSNVDRLVSVQDHMKRRLQQNPRSFFGADMGSALALIRELNRGKVRNNIVQLIRDIHEVTQIGKRSGYPKGVKLPLQPNAKEPFKRIDAELSRLRLTPSLYFPTRNGWMRGWDLQRAYAGADHIPEDWQQLAVIVDLAALGLLAKVRACSRCKRWFFGKREDHQFCSTNCRVSHDRRSIAGKVKRAAYMRRYRNSLKRRDDENKRVVRANQGKRR